MKTPRNDQPPAGVSLESNPSENGDSLGEQLLRSDRTYFELGGHVETIGPARLAWMPDLSTVPAACVVHVDDAATSTDWLAPVEARIRQLGHRYARIYLFEEASVASVLEDRGYRKRLEIGYGEVVADNRAEPEVALRPVETKADWSDKLAIHGESAEAADGYPAPASDWVRLERSKCETGGMTTYIVERGDDVCGTVCSMDEIDLLRIKNLLIRPSYRRQGCGTEIISAFRSVAKERGKSAIGVFGVLGSAGYETYQAAGLEPICRIVEWSKLIGKSSKSDG